MLNHRFVARLKSDFPFVASLGSRAYSIVRSGANKRIVKNATRPAFTGTIIDVMSGQVVPQNEVLKKLDTGHILLAKDFLNNTGLTKDFASVMSGAYGIPYEDLNRIHELLTIDQILDVTEKLKMDERILGLECSIFYGLFGYSPELYAELMPNLRPQVPYKTVRGKEQEIEARVGRGKMNAHGPHKDSWRFHPSNTINVWLALSDVTPLNGMMLVPHSTDYLPKFADNEIVPGCDTYPERQYLTQMSTGDVLLFRAELMHGSILNQTEQTRFAFSMRCTVEEPDFHRDFMYNYVRIAPSFSNLTKVKVAARSSFEPASRDESFADFGPQERPLRDNSREENGELIVNTPEGEKTFCARCPHQGVPLRDGRLENGRIVCSQHQLRVEPISR
ncbi:MAG: phytanoyl-CoA dioxygenase family protein [Acidimicrobiaceae bacterium]|jgi:hypothetical protein|nr:phytanoyl-CoA dioxygenase family protein [Ilumatobacteraceae bacterium]